MTPEAQNMAIHEFIGGNKFVGLKKRGLWYRPDAKGYTSDENQAGRYTQEEAKGHEYVRGDADEWVRICHFKVPNYTGSLDAMHEAEKALKGSKDDEHSELSGYYEQLCLVCGDGLEPLNVYDIDLVRSTAAQRAEAFLKAVGRWKEKGEK